MKITLTVWGLFLFAACVTGKPIPETTELIPVKGGTFVFGSSTPCEQEFTCKDLIGKTGDSTKFKPIYPPMKVTVKDFYIDAHEVTNAQYDYCAQMGECPSLIFSTFQAASGVDYSHDPAYSEFPAVGITLLQAKAYCKFVGKRLPTEFEWELVASGDHLMKPGEDIASAEAKKQEFPNKYADTFADDYNKICNGIQIPGCSGTSGLMPSPVGSNSNDVVKLSSGNVYDLTGNVSEWVIGIPIEPTEDEVDYVTCKADLPDDCKDPHWCFNPDCIDDKPADPDYCPDKCYTNNDLTECQSAQGVFRMCEQGSFHGLPICVKYTAAITQEDLFKRFEKNNQMRNKTTVRGCSYSDHCWGYSGKNFICGTRSSARHILTIPTNSKVTDPQIGFRCAADQ